MPRTTANSATFPNTKENCSFAARYALRRLCPCRRDTSLPATHPVGFRHPQKGSQNTRSTPHSKTQANQWSGLSPALRRTEPLTGIRRRLGLKERKQKATRPDSFLKSRGCTRIKAAPFRRLSLKDLSVGRLSRLALQLSSQICKASERLHKGSAPTLRGEFARVVTPDKCRSTAFSTDGPLRHSTYGQAHFLAIQ